MYSNSITYSTQLYNGKCYPKAKSVFNVPLVNSFCEVAFKLISNIFRQLYILLLPAALDDVSFDIPWLYQAMVWSPVG